MSSSAIMTIETKAKRPNLFLESSSFPCKIKHSENLSKKLIGQALRERVESLDPNSCEAGEEDTFFVADLGEVYRQHLRWKMNLPNIRPYYAIKCNPDPQVIRLLSELGTGFDCASIVEIKQVLNMNVDPSRIIYAQPCKTNSYVRYAASTGIKKMTFDSTDELYKIKKIFPEAELFLRISTDDSGSVYRLSEKYGASMDTTEELLDLARLLELRIVGVSFHIGSSASDPLAFRRAVQDARTVFDQAADRGMRLNMLDVGGGFTGENFEVMARELNQAIEDLIPFYTTIIGEPGRYFVSSAFTLASHVIGRRTIEDQTRRIKSHMLFLNDGLYGNFSGIKFEGQFFDVRVLRAGNKMYYDDDAAKPKPRGAKYSMWGPTCDSTDRIVENICFDHNLKAGDWFYFENMGAYTSSCSTSFNGFKSDNDVVYVVSEPGAKSLLDIK